MGATRDAGLPHRDARRRPGLRRRRRGRDGSATRVSASTTVVIPVVGECDDSWLSDARVAHVQPADVARAVADATADFEQGAVGAGAGNELLRLEGRHRLVEPARRRSHRRRPPAHELRLERATPRRRRPDRPAARRAARRGARSRWQLHRRRRHRRAARTAAARAARAPRRPRARAGGLGRPPRQRRDLRRVRDVRRALVRRTASSTRSSRRPSTRRRRRCLCSLWAAVDTTGREGRVVRALPRKACSSSTAAAAGRGRRTAAARDPARRGPSPPTAG